MCGSGRQLPPPAVHLLRLSGVPDFRGSQGAILLEVLLQEQSVQPKLSPVRLEVTRGAWMEINCKRFQPIASFPRGAAHAQSASLPPSLIQQLKTTAHAQTDLTYENYAQSLTRPPLPSPPSSTLQLLEIYYKSTTRGSRARAHPDVCRLCARTARSRYRPLQPHMVLLSVGPDGAISHGGEGDLDDAWVGGYERRRGRRRRGK